MMFAAKRDLRLIKIKPVVEPQDIHGAASPQ
jgi:hypothetical protein